ncbi:CDT1-like protein a, chloroplastic [Zea mays]|uniref:CDT1-like protein a, chloroplastic n=1 Tax=Zea mays TaxID=4577 RepID=UPI001651FFD4|nr:CDT1-like protein a, chloroplastic [Zea mays]
MAKFNNIATQVEILAKRKLSYCHLAQMKYLFREAIQIKRVLLHDEKSLCMYADMEIILVMDVVEYTSPDHSPSMAICDAFYSKLLTFLDAHQKVPAKEQVDALSKELFALSTVTGILSTLLATCVIVLTNKIYNLSEQIDAIVSLF